MLTHQRPDLRGNILALLAKLVPAVREGGEVPLTELVAAVVGAKLTEEVRLRLDARGMARFVREPSDALARFSNEGPEARIALKRFDLKLSRRLSGTASISGDQALLRFDPEATLVASKLLLSVRLVAVTLDERRVVVSMGIPAFDQVIELG